MRLDFKVIIEPDVEPPSHGAPIGTLTKGWIYNPSADYDCISKACSSTINHGYGWEKTSIQRAVKLYSTKELAMKAYRAALADAFERKLAEIDKLIAQEA